MAKLGEIAEIQFGPYQKTKAKGSFKYLHASHFDDFCEPTYFEESYVESNDRNERFLLQPNDVILAGKGQRIFAWAYKSELGQAIPSSLFYILRTDPNEVLGSYLASYLNTDRMQYELNLIGSGATITSIPKKELQELKIALPAISEQHRMVSIIKLFDKDVILTNRLLEKKKQLKKGILNTLLTKH